MVRYPAREVGEVGALSAGVTGVIKTKRLRMRAHRDDDLTDLVGLTSSWEIARWTGTIPHPYNGARSSPCRVGLSSSISPTFSSPQCNRTFCDAVLPGSV